jgi:PKHD-type hydroxylase
MQIAIAEILSPDDLRAVHTALGAARLIEGKKTAGFAAKGVKDNLQADAADRSLDDIRKRVADRLLGNDVFKLAVRPKQLGPLLFSRYEPGMQYGSHVDDAVMHGMRTDISFTLFLDDPASYGGGELVIETSGGNDAIKLAAGACFVYPSTSLHHVAPVSNGVRHVVAGWVRSYVRDAAQRELLFDLDTARRRIFSRDGKSTEFDLLSKSLANLLRMWVED